MTSMRARLGDGSLRAVMPAACMGALVALLSVAGARAEDSEIDSETGSTYARVRYVDGGVTLQHTGEGELVEGIVNSPLAPGDLAWTEEGRAEIALADGAVLRLDTGTRIDIRTLADIDNRFEKTNLIALEQGSLRVTTPEPESSDKVFQIDTDGGSVYLLSGGSYRIDVDGGICTVSSVRGVAELSGDGGSVLVRSGERSSVGRGRSPAEPRPFNTLRLDDFDRFCEERDGAYLRRQGQALPSEAVREMPQEVAPYTNELSVYGDWRQVPTYGWVWRPAYSGAWGPYLNGHWVWYPTGWIWVSYDPWGWAPYHYGRWDFLYDAGWVWIPGRVWSGAWVSFAVGRSYIGWCPLNYYNRPVYSDVSIVNVVNVNVGRLDPRGWRFIQAGRFGLPRGDRTILRSDRLPRGTELAMGRRLPRFDAREIAGRQDKAERLVEQVRASSQPSPVPRGAGDRQVPFRALERGEARARPAARMRAPMESPVGPRREERAPQAGSGFGGPQVRPRQMRERSGQPPAISGGRPQTVRPMPRQGASRALPRNGMREPFNDQGGTSGRDPVRPAPRDASRPRPDVSTPAQERPRGHAAERLFDGVRRDRTPNRAAPQPERFRPQQAPPQRGSPPPERAGPQQARPQRESAPRPNPKREERPPRPDTHH
jgi:FecR protein